MFVDWDIGTSVLEELSASRIGIVFGEQAAQSKVIGNWSNSPVGAVGGETGETCREVKVR
jgi:hypothetical protein